VQKNKDKNTNETFNCKRNYSNSTSFSTFSLSLLLQKTTIGTNNWSLVHRRVDLCAVFVSFILAHRYWRALATMSKKKRNKKLLSSPLVHKPGLKEVR